MQKFTEIGQFRQVIREVKTNYDYRGEDKDGSPIYVHDQIYPTLTFRGTVKLHGCLDENGNEVLMTKDHIWAKANGGKSNLANYQTMCHPCNHAKGRN